MEVSDDNDLWVVGLVFCKVNGIYIGKCGNDLIMDWKYARPIEPPKKVEVNLQQIAEKFDTTVPNLVIKSDE